MLIVHLHAFKCAGSTFSWILEKNFPGCVLYVESKNPSKRLKWSEAEKMLAKKSHTRAITSHLLECPPISSENKYYIVELIRNPIDRYLSAYRFQKKVGQIQSETSFVQYLQAHRNTIRSNFISRHLSPQSFDSVEGKQQGWKLNTASINLNRDDLFVGTVERFDESMILLENSLQAQGLTVDLSYPHVQNQSSEDPSEGSFFDGIPDDLLQELTCEDMTLMTNVNNYLDCEIARTTNFDELLQAYRNRCVDLAKSRTSTEIRTPPPAKWKYVH